jgi:CBS domain-containing protein
MNVETLLRTKGSDVFTTTPDSPVRDAVAVLAAQRIGALVVTAPDGSVIGVLSERDVVRRLADTGAPVLQAPVSQLMSPDVVTCVPGDDLASMMELMTARRIRHVPVLGDGRLVGIVSIGDVVKARVDELEDDRRALHNYIEAR